MLFAAIHKHNTLLYLARFPTINYVSNRILRNCKTLQRGIYMKKSMKQLSLIRVDVGEVLTG